MIKLLRFDQHWIVAEVEEIPGVEFGDPDCVLKYPCEATRDGLVPFPEFSDDRELVIRSSDITLICDPNDMYMALYYDLKDKETE